MKLNFTFVKKITLLTILSIVLLNIVTSSHVTSNKNTLESTTEQNKDAGASVAAHNDMLKLNLEPTKALKEISTKGSKSLEIEPTAAKAAIQAATGTSDTNTKEQETLTPVFFEGTQVLNLNKEVLVSIVNYFTGKIAKEFKIEDAEKVLKTTTDAYFNSIHTNIEFIDFESEISELKKLNDKQDSLSYYLLARMYYGDIVSRSIFYRMDLLKDKLASKTTDEIEELFTLVDIVRFTDNFSAENISFYTAYKIANALNDNKFTMKALSKDTSSAKKNLKKTRTDKPTPSVYPYSSCLKCGHASYTSLLNLFKSGFPRAADYMENNKSEYESIAKLETTTSYPSYNNIEDVPLKVSSKVNHLQLGRSTMFSSAKKTYVLQGVGKSVEIAVHERFLMNCLGFAYGIQNWVNPMLMAPVRKDQDIDTKDKLLHHLVQYLLLKQIPTVPTEINFQKNKFIDMINKRHNKLVVEIYSNRDKPTVVKDNITKLKADLSSEIKEYYTKKTDGTYKVELCGANYGEGVGNSVRFYFSKNSYCHADGYVDNTTTTNNSPMMYFTINVDKTKNKSWVSKFGQSILATHTESDLTNALGTSSTYGSVRYIYCHK